DVGEGGPTNAWGRRYRDSSRFGVGPEEVIRLESTWRVTGDGLRHTKIIPISPDMRKGAGSPLRRPLEALGVPSQRLPTHKHAPRKQRRVGTLVPTLRCVCFQRV